MHLYAKTNKKCTARSKSVLFKLLCKKNFGKFKLSNRRPLLWNKIIAPNNNLLEAETINMFKILKIRLKKVIFVATNIREGS